MSSPLVKISDQSWSLSCLCCSCTQEVRDTFKMVVGPAFVEYNHRFTCPYCQTYNQILLDRAMFEQAQVMIMHQPPVETFEPDTESIKTQEGPALQNQNQFEADIPTLLVMPSDLFPENKAPVLSSKNSPPSFESATETSTATLEAKTKVAAIEKLGKEQKQPPVFEQAPSPKKASSSVIKIAGREIEQRLLILGGGGALAVVAVIVFFLFKSDPVPPPRPVPPIVGQKQPPTTPPKPTPNQVVQKTDLDKDMVEIPEGEYVIGSNDGSDYERPEKTVTIKAFKIDIHEVTNEEYYRFVTEAHHKAPKTWVKGKYKGDGKIPVTDVDWNDASAYAKWAGKRLPTEEEWEVASSGEKHLTYPWGNEWVDAKANTREYGSDGPTPVGTFSSKSPFGLVDTVGNVWEWTSSNPSAYGGASAKIEGKNLKVIRGGAYNEGMKVAKTFSRNWVEAETVSPALGFRCVKEIQQKEKGLGRTQ